MHDAPALVMFVWLCMNGHPQHCVTQLIQPYEDANREQCLVNARELIKSFEEPPVSWHVEYNCTKPPAAGTDL